MKFVDLSGLPVTWTKIGTMPVVTPGQNVPRPFTCVVNGYFGMFWPLGNGPGPTITKGAILFLFDGKGGMCTYQTIDYTTIADKNLRAPANSIWQSNNTFVWALGDGNTWKMIIPNVFQAGVTYTLPYTQLPTPSPCGGGTYSGTIFCGQQNVYANKFIQAFPESDNYWASIYDGLGNFLGGGYIGNSPNDLFDKRAIQLPPLVNTNQIYDRNGVTVYGNFGSVSGTDQVVGSMINWLNGNPGSLICGAPNATVFVNGKNFQQIYYSRDFGLPGFNASSDNVIMGTTDFPHALLYPDSNVMKILSGNFYIQLPTLSPNSPVAYFTKTRQLYNVAGNNGQDANDVYVASLDLSPFGPAPNFQMGDFPGLANYHRAVSPTGSFQA